MSSVYIGFVFVLFILFFVLCLIKKNKISLLNIIVEKIVIVLKIFIIKAKYILGRVPAGIYIVILFAVVAVFVFNLFNHNFLPQAGVFLFLPIVFVFGVLFSLTNKDEKTEYYGEEEPQKFHDCREYIELNCQRMNLFMRSTLNKSMIILANKYTVVEFNLENFGDIDCGIDITDKMAGEKYCIRQASFGIGKIWKYDVSEIFEKICDSFNYETKLADIVKYFDADDIQNYAHADNYLDINYASEAEMTTLPGITIAKAKRAIKMRNKNIQFLTMNQFYSAINLDEQFIEQIKAKGNKVLLNELPMYRGLEKKNEKNSENEHNEEMNILFDLPKENKE